MPYYTPGSRGYARIMVARGLNDGTIIRATHCENCGVACHTHGHHHNGYSEAHATDLQWLCVGCHARIHSQPEAAKVMKEFPELYARGPRKLKAPQVSTVATLRRKNPKLPRGHEKCGQSCLLVQIYGS